MTQDLAQVMALVEQLGVVGFAVFLRVGAAMAVLPAFGEQMIPARVRLLLALGFTVIVAPAVYDDVAPGLGGNQMVLFLTEPVAGMVYGFAVRFMIMALQIAGSMAAQSVSLSQLVPGANNDYQTVVGQLLVAAGLALAVSLGLHLELADGLIETYRIFPFGARIEAASILEWALPAIAQTFQLGFRLAMPFVIAALLYNTALGVINRAMPQLMVTLVARRRVTAGGMVLMALAMPGLLWIWTELLAAQLAQPF